MIIRNEISGVLAIKDEETERPIPSAWRSVIREIVSAFVRQDYRLSAGVPGVSSVSAETATQIKDYIQDYGETLIELPDETWNSSVCIWMGERWNALIDLWTLSEGRSDLVLRLDVSEADDGFVFHIYMVYVP
jgi:hypothetical protein